MECLKRNGFHPPVVVETAMMEKVNCMFSHDMINLSKKLSVDIDSMEFAKQLDKEDVLRDFRKRFHYPKKKDIDGIRLNNMMEANEECIYFCGHSLGLQLKCIENRLQHVLEDWAQKGVECHFQGRLPAASCDKGIQENMAYLIGAKPDEVALVSGLTVNIHVMLSSFYHPTEERYKILMVDGGFHSDSYAVQSHIEGRNFDPDESIIRLEPRPGDDLINPEDILEVIEERGREIALIFLEGVHYYTGQLFDMKEITRAGHKQGCVVGFDLAHAVGNVTLELHDWNVDFGVWCTYKYLNSGPGCVGAVYCHQQHTQGPDGMLPAMRGWWGLSEDRKFAFDKDFTPAKGAGRFKLSNPSPFLSTMIASNLEVFKEAGNERLRHKQRFLTGYLDYLLRKNFPQGKENDKPHIHIITPSDPRKRGSQISLFSSIPVSKLDTALKANGIVCDKRKPSVIRVTPAPLYNTYTEVYQFVHKLKEIWNDTLSNERKLTTSMACDDVRI